MDQKRTKPRRGPGAERAAPRYLASLKYDVAPIEKALCILAPGGSPQLVLAAFDNRTTLHTIRDWRRGKRAIPQWARDLLKAKAATITAAATDSPSGPGQRSGLRNMPHELTQR